MPQTQIEMYRQKASMLDQAVDVIMAVAAAMPAQSPSVSTPPACFLLLELGDDLILLRVVTRSPLDALLLRCLPPPLPCGRHHPHIIVFICT